MSVYVRERVREETMQDIKIQWLRCMSYVGGPQDRYMVTEVNHDGGGTRLRRMGTGGAGAPSPCF